jgi:CRP-like cAMP-binding protein
MIRSHHCAAAVEVDNQLLDALPSDTLVATDLERVELVRGQWLQEAGTALKYVYFPTTAVVSLVSGMQDGGLAEVAVVGHEGVLGVCAFMGGGCALSSGVVQIAGHAWRMRAPVLAYHAARNDSVMLPLLRYTQALFVQLAQTSACHRCHSLHQQLCRWLLLHQERHQCNDILVTHEGIANLLGVRRETVTACASRLQSEGMIRYRRGHLTILDRKGLEHQSCECYEVIKSAYDRLSQGCVPMPAAAPHREVDGGRMLSDTVQPPRRPAALLTLPI